MTEAQETQAYVRMVANHVLRSFEYALLSASAAMFAVMLAVTWTSGDFPDLWWIPVAGTATAAFVVRYMRSGVPVVPRSTKAAQPAPGQVARDA